MSKGGYALVRHNDLEKFLQDCGKLIRAGWKPAGGFVGNTSQDFMQAFWKEPTLEITDKKTDQQEE